MVPLFTNKGTRAGPRQGGRGPARDVVALQDQIQSLSPDQISVGVNPVPVGPTTLVQASVDVGERSPALVLLVEHKQGSCSPVGYGDGLEADGFRFETLWRRPCGVAGT